MIKNFEEVKTQLKELASIINQFKSEAVQLRIVELIFQGTETESEAGQEGVSSGLKAKKRRVKKKTQAAKKTPEKKVKRGKVGPATALDELIQEGFFKSPHTINGIITYCSSQRARIFKPNELSTPLARFVRNKKLKRAKNSDGQYQYKEF